MLVRRRECASPCIVPPCKTTWWTGWARRDRRAHDPTAASAPHCPRSLRPPRERRTGGTAPRRRSGGSGVFRVTVNAPVATLHELPTPNVAEAPVSPVRGLLGRYQQVLARVDESGRVLTAPIGRRRFTRWLRVPASRRAVSLLLTVHVRARLRVLMRRSNARAALLKDCGESRRDLERLEHFRSSLRPTPGVKLAAPLALVGVLLAAYVLANWIVPLDQADFLGDLTKAAVKLDAGDMVDAAAENHMDAASLLVALTVIFWSMALVMLPLVPAAT